MEVLLSNTKDLTSFQPLNRRLSIDIQSQSFIDEFRTDFSPDSQASVTRSRPEKPEQRDEVEEKKKTEETEEERRQRERRSEIEADLMFIMLTQQHFPNGAGTLEGGEDTSPENPDSGGGNFLSKLLRGSEADVDAEHVMAETGVGNAKGGKTEKDVLDGKILQHLQNIKAVKAGDETVELDLDGIQNNTEKIQSKLLSEFADFFNREGRIQNRLFSVNSVEGSSTTTSDTSIHSIGNTADIASATSRQINSLLSGGAVRTTGFRELLDNVVYVIKGNNKLGVTVEHENLGKLNIRLSLDKGMVNIHINTADKAIREFIENNIQYIIDSLNKDGVSVGEFSIALRDQKDREEGFHSFDKERDEDTFKKASREEHIIGRGIVSVFA